MFTDLFAKFETLKPYLQENGNAIYSEIHDTLLSMKKEELGSGINCRDLFVKYIITELNNNNLHGPVAEIGCPDTGLGNAITDRKFTYLSLYPADHPNTVVADITNCPQVEDESFDAVVSVSCFEHLSRPWRAAEEITRILKPGGITCHFAPFSFYYHEGPLDYWRFSPDGLQFLFRDLEPLKVEWFGGSRRRNNIGTQSWPMSKSNKLFTADALGGWRENWYSIYIGRKTPNWENEQKERNKNQLAIELCFIAIRGGMSPDIYPQKVAYILSRLAYNKSGEIFLAKPGQGISMEPNEIRKLWDNHWQHGLKPTAIGYSIAAMLGEDNHLR